ncbi:extensin-like domain-containing protein [Limimaricola cinnabarinus]|uniref:extensin-like domain-containing protein n=1 Tax=Limimaricola cinnabarinus TaxID=1125964 RepID=UPI002FE05643
MRPLALALMLAGAPALAQEAVETDAEAGPEAAARTAPETAPLPEARPEGLAPGGGGAEEDAESPQPSGPATPAPEAAEDAPPEEAEAEAPTTPDVAARDRVPPMPERLAMEPEAREACLAALDALGAVYETSAAVEDAEIAECGIVHPVTLSGIVPGVALSPPAPMRCETALALARWVEGFAIPAAERLERGALTEIRQGTVYNCRSRSSDAEIMSEHAFGNAVDIISFGFAEGEEVKVQPREREGSMAEAFQDAVRATSCLEFTTVLGPGSDAAHADHLHLDVKSRRGGFRLCQ